MYEIHIFKTQIETVYTPAKLKSRSNTCSNTHIDKEISVLNITSIDFKDVTWRFVGQLEQYRKKQSS